MFRKLLAGALLAAITAACDPPATETEQQQPPPRDLTEVVAKVEPSVVTVLPPQGVGSGVVFRDGGLVLTNAHVVGDADQVQLILADGERVAAQVVATDTVTDLAVLRAADSGLPPAEFRTELPEPGETVLALGSPLGLRNSVTAGIVSGVGRDVPGSAQAEAPLVDLIQTDAPISPGNSGGALVDAMGRVVGINEAYLPPQTGAVSIGFAIPAATALDVADDLLDDGVVTHSYVGVVVGRLTPQIAQMLGAPNARGVLIRQVVEGGPAAQAGLRSGDIIVRFDNQETSTLERFLGALRGVEPGQAVPLGYLREGRQQQTTVNVAAQQR